MHRPKPADFNQIRPLAQKVLLACGHTRILNVGCRDGGLVHALLEQGCDAYGIDSGKRLPGRGLTVPPARFSRGSVSKLPFPTGSFDGLVVTHGLDDLNEDGLHRAIRELYRVSRRYVLLQINTRNEPIRGTAQIIRGRNWWENVFFSKGFRKALSAGSFQDFESFETEPDEILIVLERISQKNLARFPLISLSRKRDLHMDMLRETGRRSEAHIARYSLASQFVRKNDRVMDAACGLGYGAAIIKASTLAESVLGIDAAKPAIKYAQASYSSLSPNLKFQQLVLPKLRGWAESSLDLVISFETLEHLKEPKSFLAEVHRVLTPGGRFICSVPNQWVDASGKDPNPYHFHTFDFGKIRDLVSAQFLIEGMYSQTAGGGMVLGTASRQIRMVEDKYLRPRGKIPDMPAEWWLVVAMKDPWQKPQPPYVERMFPEGGTEPPNYLAFARDYQNPWLIRSMISIGSRACSDSLLRKIADDTLVNASRESADYGAAICVLLYRYLPQSRFAGRDLARLLQFAENYLALPTRDNPHVKRWEISIQFALGLFYTKSGAYARAIAHLEKCTATECREFSHLLATKTVRAAHLAAILHLSLGQRDDAMRLWRHGLDTAYRILSDSLPVAVGNLELPPDFALRELTQILDFAQQCSVAISLKWEVESQRPLFGRLVAGCLTDEIANAKDSLRQLQVWNEKLTKAKDWQADQNKALDTQLKKANHLIAEQKKWGDLQLTNAQKEQRALQAELIKLRDWNAELSKASAWQADQNKTLAAQLKEAARLASEQKKWNGKLEKAKLWLEGQLTIAQTQPGLLHAELKKLRAWNTELTKAKDWQADQNKIVSLQLKKAEQLIAEQKKWSELQLASAQKGKDALHIELKKLHAWVAELTKAKDWQADQNKTLALQLKKADHLITEQKKWGELQLANARKEQHALQAELEKLREWNAKLTKASEWQATQNESLATQLKEATRLASEQKKWGELQLASTHTEADVLRAELKKLRKWNDELVQAKDWQVAQNGTLAAQLKKADRLAAEQSNWAEAQLANAHAETGAFRTELHKLRDWNAELTKAAEWQATQNETLAAQLKEAARLATEQKQWGEAQLASAHSEIEIFRTELEKLREWNAELIKASEWQAAQNDALTAQLKEATRLVNEQKQWSAGQLASTKAETEAVRAELQKLRDWNAELIKAKDWQAAQNENLAVQLTETTRLATEQKKWGEAQLASAHSEIEIFRTELEKLRDWNAELAQAKEWQAAQSEALTTQLKEADHLLGEQKQWSEMQLANSKAEGDVLHVELQKLRDWNAELANAKDWQAAQKQILAAQLEEVTRLLTEQKQWSERQLANAQTEKETLHAGSLELRAWNAELVKARDWQATQSESLALQLKEATRLATEQKQWNGKLDKARLWLEEQLAVAQTQQQALAAELKKLYDWNLELTKARDWQAAQKETFAAQIKAAADLALEQKEWSELRLAKVQAEADALRSELQQLRDWNAELIKAKDWQAAQSESLGTKLADAAKIFQAQQDWIAILTDKKNQSTT